MARSQSFGKRENEKKKVAKRLEKQRRKADRQTGGTASADEMIAYVDENGRITSTPPEERVKTEVKLEDIEIATPKRGDEEPEFMEGRVDYYNSDKGYGFIREQATGEKYFFHVTAAPEGIGEGRIVRFTTERGPRGPQAAGISFVK